MPSASTDTTERIRLDTLHGLGVLDTAAEPIFDAITAAAAQVCDVPIALLTMVDADRQWFKSNRGLAGIQETPRDMAFCNHVIASDHLFEVSDVRRDARFAGNPLVTGNPNVRFYAGAPIVMPGGDRIGTVCVIDRRERHLSATQQSTLRGLARIASAALTDRSRHMAAQHELVASESRVEQLAGEQAEQAAAAPALETSSVRAEHSSILLIGGDAEVNSGLTLKLEALGYTVVGVANNASEALELARATRPSLALMDVSLAGEARRNAEALRREADTPVVLLTLGDDAGAAAGGAQDATYGYVARPAQPKVLRAGIEVALWKARLERQLRVADRWFAMTLRCVHDGVIVVDGQACVRLMNPAAEALLGCSSEEASGQPVADLVRFDDAGGDGATLVLQALTQDRVTGFRYARQLIRRHGAPVPVDESAGPVHDDRGQRLGAVLVLRDATPRLQQQALLRASEERFRSAFESAPLGMALVSLDGRFLQVNQALCQLLACTPEWLLQRSQADISGADDIAHEQTRLIELQTRAESMTQFEKRYLRATDQLPVWVLIHASMLSESDAAACYLYQVHDLTPQKAAAMHLAELADERIKREASDLANRSTGQFLTHISHEMRTPLNAVLGFAELLKQQQASGQAAPLAYSEHILSAGKHLLALVEDVLDLQRASDGTLRLHPGHVALEPALLGAMQLLEPMADARHVRLLHSIDGGLALHLDEMRLRQILLNLGSNAIKYNASGGTVRFNAARVAIGRVRITVEDTGIGMSDEELAHLFEPFNRLGREALRIPGVGLGLVITRQLVERMGGSITVAGAAQGGTVVTLEFPEACG